jgi:hypothetical protein
MAMEPPELTKEKAWREDKAKGRKGEVFVINLLTTAGYDVIPFGIETRSEEMKRMLKGNYGPIANKRLFSMPDVVVIDREKKHAWFVEVKYTERKFSEETNFYFKPKQIHEYRSLWQGMVLIFVFDSEPYYKCINVYDIRDDFLVSLCKDVDGNIREFWRFKGVYEDIWTIFSRTDKADVSKGR